MSPKLTQTKSTLALRLSIGLVILAAVGTLGLAVVGLLLNIFRS